MSERRHWKNRSTSVETRRNNAEVRRLEREGRTPAEQLKLIDERPGNSTRERNRLTTQVEKSQK